MSRALSKFSNPVRVLLIEDGKRIRGGLDIPAAWRAAGHAEPVLILTARDAVAGRATGLNTGADDYLCEPLPWINWPHGFAPWLGAAAATRREYNMAPP